LIFNQSGDRFPGWMLQPFPALNYSVAGQVSPAIPKQIKEDKHDRCGWTLLPFLKQLKPGDSFIVQSHDFTIEDR
jgi:hypothetical protein